MAYRLGVDVGGTFTDLCLVDDNDVHWRVKTPSTPADPSQGVLAGVRRICAEAGIGPEALGNVVHGTTVATNAVLESKGARVGLITTRGFGQILHLARSQTPGPLAGWIIMVKPDPPASLADTREAVERMDARGETLVPVDREQVAGIVRDLVESGRRVAHRVAHQRLRRRAPRARDRRPGGGGLSGLPGHHLLGRPAGVPGVRADADGVHELLRAPARGRVRGLAAGLAARARGAQRAGHPALRRRRHDATGGGAQPRLRRAVRAERGRGRGAARRRAGGLPERADLRHGRHLDRRVAVPGGRADDRSRDGDRPVPDQGAVRRRAHGRRGRRLDRACAPAHARAARRTGVGRRGARARGLRQGRHGADGDRRQRRRRPPAAAPDRRRDGARHGGGAHRRRAGGRGHRPVGRRGGRGDPRRSSTRTWPAPCG